MRVVLPPDRELVAVWGRLRKGLFLGRFRDRELVAVWGRESRPRFKGHGLGVTVEGLRSRARGPGVTI